MRDVAPDGSPVAVYRSLSGEAEAEVVSAAVASGASILELGSGAGRVTHELVARGFRVTAVDESPEMLAHVRDAETVCSRIEALELHRMYDCVLCASHLINAADSRERRALLSVARRHLSARGVLLVETYPPHLEWIPGRAARVGDVELRLVDVVLERPFVHATMEYALGDQVWRQQFSAYLLADPDLREVLAEEGLAFDRWLDRDRGWLLARAR